MLLPAYLPAGLSDLSPVNITRQRQRHGFVIALDSVNVTYPMQLSFCLEVKVKHLAPTSAAAYKSKSTLTLPAQQAL